MANVGVGSITDKTKTVPFYPAIAQKARAYGISISVVGMEGEDCSMENLGTVADLTAYEKKYNFFFTDGFLLFYSGSVEIVDPLNMSSKVVSMMNKLIIASNLKATVVMGGIDVRSVMPEKSEKTPKRDFVQLLGRGEGVLGHVGIREVANVSVR
jgi:hypothetical protein